MIDGFCTVVNILCKGAAIYDAGKKVVDTCNKDKMTTSDKVNVAAQVLFIGAQTADIGMQFAPSVSNSSSNAPVHDNARLGVRIALGAMDVTRKITDRVATKESWSMGDTLDIVGVIAYRGSDVLQTALQTHKNHDWVCNNRIAIEDTAKIVGTLGGLVANRDSLASLGSGCKVLVYSSIRRTWRFIRGRNTPAAAAPVAPAAPSAAAGTSVFQPAAGNANANAAANVDDFKADQQQADVAFEKQVQALQNWETLEEIPSIFAQHAAFDRCRLSGRAIRHIKVPNFDTEDATLIYDKYALDSWMKEHPDQSPPGWPSSVPFHLNKLFTPASSQRKINEMLAGLAKEMAEHYHQK